LIASSYFSAKNVLAQGSFYPPRLSLQERTGFFSGLSTTGMTSFDGAMVFQTGSGQALFVVQSGMWKQASLV
jgi:hypothetical protein